MNTSKYSNTQLALLIGRYLLVRTVAGFFRLMGWFLIRTLMVVDAALGFIASPLSSGRDENEFKDMVRPEAPEHERLRGESHNSFWSLYFQAYTPRLWRMRRMFPMAMGRHVNQADSKKEDP